MSEQRYYVTETQLNNIADAIREKKGTTSKILIDNMPSEIRGIGHSDAYVAEIIPTEDTKQLVLQTEYDEDDDSVIYFAYSKDVLSGSPPLHSYTVFALVGNIIDEDEIYPKITPIATRIIWVNNSGGLDYNTLTGPTDRRFHLSSNDDGTCTLGSTSFYFKANNHYLIGVIKLIKT